MLPYLRKRDESGTELCVDVRNPIMLIEILNQQSFGFSQCSDLNPVKRLVTLSY
jgi:hypothetical protein